MATLGKCGITAGTGHSWQWRRAKATSRGGGLTLSASWLKGLSLLKLGSRGVNGGRNKVLQGAVAVVDLGSWGLNPPEGEAGFLAGRSYRKSPVQSKSSSSFFIYLVC